MKKFNSVLSAVALFIATTVFAQNTTNKWLIGVGAHAVDYTSARGVFDGYFDTNDYSIVPPLSKLSIARSLNKSFAVDLQASVGEIDNKRLQIEDEFYLLAGLGLRYKLTNGYILKETSWFDPYLRVGANYHKYDYTSYTPGSYDGNNDGVYDASFNGTNSDEYYAQDVDAKKDNFAINGGAGINFWITKHFGLNIESQYVWLPSFSQDYFNHFQHSASIIFKFGEKKPVGPCEGKGGDTDGDGVCDADDQCPSEPGPADNNGCPIKEKCADTDGDGICDADDKCPKDANNDSDGDGICDSDDKCPNEAGIKEKQGCKDISKDVGIALKGLLFDTSKATIRKSEVEKIKKAADLIKSTNDNYYIDGHTDSSGREASNWKLSEDRAAAVVKALEAQGVQPGRLTSRGYGPSQPVCPANDTPSCKQENRRVDVYDTANSSAPAAPQKPTKFTNTVNKATKSTKATGTKAVKDAKATGTKAVKDAKATGTKAVKDAKATGAKAVKDAKDAGTKAVKDAKDAAKSKAKDATNKAINKAIK